MQRGQKHIVSPLSGNSWRVVKLECQPPESSISRLKQSETNACRREVQTIPPHMSCDVEEFVMTHTQPITKISVEKLLRSINPEN